MRVWIQIAIALSALACAPADASVEDISAAELQARAARGDVPMILDVRTAEEFASGHVPGAVNIPHDEVAGRIAELQEAREEGLVLYCERGGRARKAAQVLSDAGFTKLAHLEGDMSGWRTQGLPVETPTALDRGQLRERAAAIFGALPSEAATEANPLTDAKISLGRMLYYEKRLSKNHDIACNSCHLLSRFGQDGEATSPGHRGQRGSRNSPTVYNAAFHIAQFWDGRAATVEEQAKGPVLNPIEMAMPSEAAVVAVLSSIPGYVEAFQAAFPGDDDPIRYDNMAAAIGAFERRLVTPGRFDAFIGGDTDALTDAEIEGLATFMDTGCITCHMGPTLGGTMYQKLGLVLPYETADQGRYDLTGDETQRQVFKVPSLRNVAETAPYFHDGGVASLERAVELMARHQLGKELSGAENDAIRAFLDSLTGVVDERYTAMPKLPVDGPATPAPDPS